VSDKTFAHYYKHKDRFYIGKKEQQWQVVLATSVGQISELWDEEDEPEVEDLLPSEVLDLIEVRVKSYWINTDRDNQIKRIAKLREHIAELDIAWVESKLERLRSNVERWETTLRGLRREVEA
jgi:hypothetical protein